MVAIGFVPCPEVEISFTVFDGDDLIFFKGDAFVDGHVVFGFAFGHFGWVDFGSLPADDERKLMLHRWEFWLIDPNLSGLIDPEDVGAFDGRGEDGLISSIDLEGDAVFGDLNGLADSQIDIVDGIVIRAHDIS